MDFNNPASKDSKDKDMLYQSHHPSGWQRIKGTLAAITQFFVHQPDYRPAGKLRPHNKYYTAARFYPFYPPIVEQKAWLEKCFEESSTSEVSDLPKN